jgi:uncharacterized membrane protein (UPF0127 family)
LIYVKIMLINCLRPMRRFAWVLLLGLGSSVANETAVIQLGGERFTVELALTPEAQRVGLMQRPHLAPGHGMLFIYPSPNPVAFWMKNTLIPLDILFFDAALHLVASHPNAQPCQADPCPHYASNQPVRYVLELPAGTASRLGVTPGAQLILQP